MSEISKPYSSEELQEMLDHIIQQEKEKPDTSDFESVQSIKSLCKQMAEEDVINGIDYSIEESLDYIKNPKISRMIVKAFATTKNRYDQKFYKECLKELCTDRSDPSYYECLAHFMLTKLICKYVKVYDPNENCCNPNYQHNFKAKKNAIANYIKRHNLEEYNFHFKGEDTLG